MAEIDIVGVPVPDAGPLFLAALGVHVVAGLTCVTSGAVTALSRKGGRVHVRSGRVYFWGLTVVFATMTVMSMIRWRENAHLFAIGVLACTAGLIGYLDRRRGPGREAVHIAAMGVSYVALLTGFYVDNARNIPVWNLLPTWSFWVLPGLVGLPITVRAIRRRRPVKEVTDDRYG